jgi:hypothetical protein
MDHNWPYVAIGYSLATVALGSYVGWLWNRLRRAERFSSRDE